MFIRLANGDLFILFLSVPLFLCPSECLLVTVRPDVVLKSNPIFSTVAQKLTILVFTRVIFFLNNPKEAIYLGHLCTKISSKDISKVAQSGHTVCYSDACKLGR